MQKQKPWIVHLDDCAEESWDDPSWGPVAWRTLLSGDRTPTSALTMGVAKIPAGQSRELRLHRHEQPEVYFVLGGAGVVSVDGREFLVRKGSAIFIPGNARHGAIASEDSDLELLYVFAADSFEQIEYVFDG